MLLIGPYELAPETGHKHLHAFLQMKEKVRRSTLLKLIPEFDVREKYERSTHL